MNNERGDITKDSTATQRIVREYYEQHYAGKFNSLDVIDKFLETNY